MSNNIELPDVSTVRATARRQWEQQQNRRLGIQEIIGQSVPWWLIIIAAVFFALSAPHTAATFDKLTPGWGWTAPFGVEFGLLYAAFRRKQEVTRTLRVIEGLLFVTAILVNGVGSLAAVVSSIGIQSLSFNQIIQQFPILPATSQVALFIVPIFALVIPIGTATAGEGLTVLLLERRERGSKIEQQWQSVAAEIEFIALRDAAINNGMTPGKAVSWASRIAGQSMGQYGDGTQALLSSGSVGTEKGQTGQGTSGTKLAEAIAMLEANPDWHSLPLRTLTDRTGINKNIWMDAKKAGKNEQN